MTLRELRQKLGELVAKSRQIIADSEKAGRNALTAEERTSYDAIDTEIDSVEESIRRLEKQEAREADLARTANDRAGTRGGEASGTAGHARGADDPTTEHSAEVRALLAEFDHIEGDRRDALIKRSTRDYSSTFRHYLQRGNLNALVREGRALSADIDVSGGAMVAPMQFVADLIKFLDNSLFIRQLATKYRVVAAQSLGAPSWDADPADFDWTTELGTGSEDSSAATGRREFTPHPVAKRIKLSNKLIRLSSINAENLVRERLGYVMGVTQEKAFLTGDGAGKPLGVFTASSQGISTARDVNTGSATGVTADGVIDALYALKEPYQRGAAWVLSREMVKRIRKLKDAQNQYLWQPGLAGGQPSSILDKPFYMSEYVPNTFTSGNYVGMVGDFSFFWIADALDMTVQRLVELYAETNQVGFIARSETDAMPVLEEAFARMKCD